MKSILGLIQEQTSNLVVAWNGKIIAINSNGTVDVESTEIQLLTAETHAKEKVYAKDLQVGLFKYGAFTINPTLKVGDNVIVLSTDTWTNTEQHKQDDYSRHTYQNGIVICGLTTTNKNINFSEDFIIDKSGTPIFTIKKWSNDVEINSNVKIVGNVDISGTSTANDHISDGVSGKGHTHSSVQPGNGSSGPPN